MSKVIRSPDERLHCLLIQPKFQASNFWNMTDSIATTGAKAIAPPLGLLTIAAMLPQHWTFQLVDLNVRELLPEEWDAADIICTGGMIPQQPGILELVDRANRTGKYVAVGGPDPTSQPEIYESADVRVLGEAEDSLPKWMASWRAGEPRGLFEAAMSPPLTNSPTPRFDLVDYRNYIQTNIQISRGCPFNCEFCDIIELYGRVPRSKTIPQVLAELDKLKAVGYRGWIDIADDNFIGNKKYVKKLLAAMEEWSRENGFPFYFSTEATMNLADDDELLDLMRRVDFRSVFMGIETPDPELLAVTQKRVNSMKPIVDRVNHVYSYGIGITAGFIVGFDNEPPGVADSMIACIEDTGILWAMVGLLVALPNTQLTRRLMREGRMISADNELLPASEEAYRLENRAGADNTCAGINFVTTRDRADVYADYRRVVLTVYEPTRYFERVLRTTRLIRPQRKQVPSPGEWKKMVRAFFGIAWWMTRNPETRRQYWSNTIRTALLGFAKFEFAQTEMAAYMHLGKQRDRVRKEMQLGIDFAATAPYPRSTKNMLVELAHA